MKECGSILLEAGHKTVGFIQNYHVFFLTNCPSHPDSAKKYT